MKGIGLVFSGGGGKGAYQIGVWKYLHELGLDQYVRSVSGTSVGALNAALFVGSDYETAENMWLSISQDKILSPREITSEDILKGCSGIDFRNPKLKKNFFVKTVAGIVSSPFGLAHSLLTRIRGEYFFSREGIINMMNECLDFTQISTSNTPCFVTCFSCDSFSVERFLINDYTDNEIITLLLATSAIPIIFPSEEFHGSKYYDGGIGDNVPVQPIYDTGVEYIIVVHLSRDSFVDRSKYPNATIIEIVPSEDLGNMLTGTLDFSADGAASRMALGYEDIKKIMGPMVETIRLSVLSQQLLKVAVQQNEEFRIKKAALLHRAKMQEEKKKNDGFDSLQTKIMEEVEE